MTITKQLFLLGHGSGFRSTFLGVALVGGVATDLWGRTAGRFQSHWYGC